MDELKMNDVKTDVNTEGLRQLAPGTVRFSIKAEDTKENESVHTAFKEFCKVETDNNYTQGLRKLLEYYQNDFKYEMLFDRQEEQTVTLEDLRGSIVELQKKPVKEEADNGCFGE